jgi:serine phosphatase RsbU (regulator of sigma subunit)
LVEARNSKGSFYSHKTLVKLLSNNSFKDINSLSDSITESIFSFTEKKGLEDDITFVLMDVK